MAKRIVARRQSLRIQQPFKPRSVIGLFTNLAYQTVLAIELVGQTVKCLRISMAIGLCLEYIPTKIFDKEFRPRDIEPIEKSARAYVQLMQYLGASDEALECLQSIIPLTPQEVHMAKARAVERQALAEERQVKVKELKAKREAAISTTTTTAATVPSTASSSSAPLTKQSTKKSTQKKSTQKTAKKDTAAVHKALDDKKPSMSKRIRQLIMEGKLTDTQIFDIVKKEHGVDDDHRWYVTWNRGWLRRAGMNPPEAKK